MCFAHNATWILSKTLGFGLRGTWGGGRGTGWVRMVGLWRWATRVVPVPVGKVRLAPNEGENPVTPPRLPRLWSCTRGKGIYRLIGWRNAKNAQRLALRACPPQPERCPLHPPMHQRRQTFHMTSRWCLLAAPGAWPALPSVPVLVSLFMYKGLRFSTPGSLPLSLSCKYIRTLAA